MPNPQSGTLLGAYRVEGTIGSGSMGEVFRGIDTGLNRRVAIKLLSEKHRDSPELRQRFVREGRAVAAISHPNVVQVFATGSFDDRPYIAMELLDGADLGSIVERGGPLDSLTAAHAVLDAAQGLNAAARAMLIHRDVKPSNLVRLSDGRVKVTDFGLAKPVDPGKEPALTAMGVVVGTPDYIAPEQARGEQIDERVDIYALGGTLYFLLTGIPPFRTGKPAEDKYLKVVARHLRNPAPDAMAVNPSADRELAELARTMMSKKPAERPSYDELIDHASRIVSRLDPAAAPRLVATRDRSRPNTIPAEPPGRSGYGEANNVESRPPAPTSPEGPRSRRTSKPSGPVPTAHPSSQPSSSKPPSEPPSPRRPAPTGPVPTAASDGLGHSAIEVPRAGLPGWLVALTFVCIALFVAGLVVYLRRDAAGADAGPPAPGASPTSSAGPSPSPATGAATGSGSAAPPTIGVIMVRKADGSPWFYVEPKPVTAAKFRQLFSAHQQDGAADAPVVMISYNEARSYAETVGARLLTSDEWDSSMATPGVAPSGDLREWVESPDEKKTVRARGVTEARPDAAQKDVTFRIAMRLNPGSP